MVIAFNFGAISTTPPRRLQSNYLVYVSGGIYSAINGSTGTLDFTNTSDAGAVINSCISNLTSGGLIEIQGSTDYNIQSGILMTNLITLQGTDQSTVLKLASGANNVDVIKSSGFSSMTITGATSGVFGCTLENLVIDGNRANNVSGGYGLRKFGYGWVIRDVTFRYNHQAGIWTEWADTPTCPSNDRCMEDYWHKVTVNNNDSFGIVFRGPHDSMVSQLVVWGNGDEGMHIETSGGIYDGDIHLVESHFYTNGGSLSPSHTGANIRLNNGSLEFADLISESQTGVSGIGINCQGGVIKGSNLWLFANDVGMILNTNSICTIADLTVHNCSRVGIQDDGNDHYLDGDIDSVNNSGAIGLLVGQNNTVAGARYDFHMTNNFINLGWANAANNTNVVRMQTYCLSGQRDVSGVGNIDYTTNQIEILARGDPNGVFVHRYGLPGQLTIQSVSGFGLNFSSFVSGNSQTITATNSGAFAPAAWFSVQLSGGTTFKVPCFNS